MSVGLMNVLVLVRPLRWYQWISYLLLVSVIVILAFCRYAALVGV